MKTNLIDEAALVFQSIERWTAFYEIEKQVGAITAHWLTKGATALRHEFDVRPSRGWTCLYWGVPQDTRWYLDGELGIKGIGIGIGFAEFELHLFSGCSDQRVRETALRVLESTAFEPLRALTGTTEYRADRKKEGSILSVRDFNPLGEVSDPNLRQRIIAWHAVNNTSEFVEKTSAKIRQITENPLIIGLIRELNAQCTKTT